MIIIFGDFRQFSAKELAFLPILFITNLIITLVPVFISVHTLGVTLYTLEVKGSISPLGANFTPGGEISPLGAIFNTFE
jgi:hypothetical protein